MGNDFNSFIENHQCTCDIKISSTNIAISNETIIIIIIIICFNFCFILFSLHTRATMMRPWSYKKKKHNQIKAYRESV